MMVAGRHVAVAETDRRRLMARVSVRWRMHVSRVPVARMTAAQHHQTVISLASPLFG